VNRGARHSAALRRFRALVESGAVSLTEVAKETGLDSRTVRKYGLMSRPARELPPTGGRAKSLPPFSPPPPHTWPGAPAERGRRVTAGTADLSVVLTEQAPVEAAQV